MPDMTQIVDDIRGFLLSYDQSLTQEVIKLASDYALACAGANKRLARCQRLLQQGLRVEALHQAREAPDLLELIQTADFPERLAWSEVVSQYNLASPAEFDAIAIEFLQSAYIEDDPLQDLLKGHRRLALMRAPLRQRIEILRQLVVKDGHNPIWNTDQQTFENARLEQIKAEANEAIRRLDLSVLSILHAEMSTKGWSVPIPKKLLGEINQKIGRLREQEAADELTELIDKLNDSLYRNDEDQGLREYARWKAIEEKFPQVVNQMISQVKPAIEWIQDIVDEESRRREYELRLDDLDNGLNDHLPREALSELLQNALSFNFGIPEDLEARYKSRIDQFDGDVRMKKTVIIGSVVGLITVLCGFFFALKR